jgi:hypothetical protein
MNEYLDGLRPDEIRNGTPVRYERRRYGRKTFTWVEWWNGKEWVSAGDPWPSVRVPKRDLDAILGDGKCESCD